MHACCMFVIVYVCIHVLYMLSHLLSFPNVPHFLPCSFISPHVPSCSLMFPHVPSCSQAFLCVTTYSHAFPYITMYFQPFSCVLMCSVHLSLGFWSNISNSLYLFTCSSVCQTNNTWLEYAQLSVCCISYIHVSRNR